MKRPWGKSGQLPCSDLSVKYALLHKIRAENWCPLSQKLELSTSLASLLFQIGTKSKFNYGVFIFNQMTRHIGLQGVKLSNDEAHWLEGCEVNFMLSSSDMWHASC